MKKLLVYGLMLIGLKLSAQEVVMPVQINLKDGGSIDARHFGQLKCGTATYQDNYIFLKGKYLDNVTEVKDFRDIEKIVLDGYSAQPEASAGNEKGTIVVYKKDGKSFTLEEAEIVMSCYGVGDKYNQIVVQIDNPITNKAGETIINTSSIYSIIFK